MAIILDPSCAYAAARLLCSICWDIGTNALALGLSALATAGDRPWASQDRPDDTIFEIYGLIYNRHVVGVLAYVINNAGAS